MDTLVAMAVGGAVSGLVSALVSRRGGEQVLIRFLRRNLVEGKETQYVDQLERDRDLTASDSRSTAA